MLPSLRRWNKGAFSLLRNICSAIYFSSNHSQCWTLNIFENHCLNRLLIPHLVRSQAAVGADFKQRQTTFCPTPMWAHYATNRTNPHDWTGRAPFQTIKQIMRTMVTNFYKRMFCIPAVSVSVSVLDNLCHNPTARWAGKPMWPNPSRKYIPVP